MTRWQYWVLTAAGALSVLLMAANLGLGLANRSLQGQIGLRQQYVQQSVQLEGLYREIVRALAELGARNHDEAVRALLQRHGITYSVAPPPPAPAAAAPRKEGK